MGMEKVLQSIKKAEQAAEQTLSDAQSESSRILSDARRDAADRTCPGVVPELRALDVLPLSSQALLPSSGGEGPGSPLANSGAHSRWSRRASYGPDARPDAGERTGHGVTWGSGGNEGGEDAAR